MSCVYSSMRVEIEKDGEKMTVVIHTANANFAREKAEEENPGWTAVWVRPGPMARR